MVLSARCTGCVMVGGSQLPLVSVSVSSAVQWERVHFVGLFRSLTDMVNHLVCRWVHLSGRLYLKALEVWETVSAEYLVHGLTPASVWFTGVQWVDVIDTRVSLA